MFASVFLSARFTFIRALVALGAITFSGIAHGQTDTWNGGNGNWSNGSMWSAGVPGSTSNVFIDGANPLASVVNLNISDTINNLTIDSDDKLSFNNGTTLAINGGTIANAGNITINGGNGSNTFMNLGANTTLSGGGTVTLSTTASGGGNAYIECSSCSFTLTNTNNTIQGEGFIGNGGLVLVNQKSGIIDANSTGGALTTTLTLNGSGGVTNAGLLEATNNGVLVVNNTVNNTGGNITATGSNATVQFIGADIQGGTLNTQSGGTLGTPNGQSATLDGSTAAGAVTLSTGSTYTEGLSSTTTVLGTITNNGNFQENGGNSNNTFMNLGTNTTLSGGGTVTLSTIQSGGGNAYIQCPSCSFTLTNTNNTIQGAGIIGNSALALNNAGTVDANSSGQALVLNGSGGITNTNLLEATSGGFLQMTNVVNNATGNITANGGTVQFIGADIQGGTLNTLNGGTLGTPNGQSATLDGSTAAGAVTLSTGSTYTEGLSSTTTVYGTITNNGNFQENGGNGNNTFMNLGANTTLSGAGTVTLSTIQSGGGNAYIECSSCGLTLTNTNNTIQGEGFIGNGGLVLVNQKSGIIDANSTGGALTTTLTLNGSGGVTNAGLLEATNNGVLVVNNTVNNTGGNITASGANATVQFIGADIQGGTLNTQSGGTLGTPNGQSATLDGSTAAGAVTLSTGSTYTEGLSSTTTILGTIINNGNFQENGGNGNNAFMNLGGNTTLSGGGTVTLSTIQSGGGNAYIECSSCGLTLTNTNNTIQGEGFIGNGGLVLVNQKSGIIDANSTGAPLTNSLTLNGSGGVTNAGLLEATNNGVLVVNNTVNNTGGNITATGSNATVQFIGADIQGGTLNTQSGGTLGTPNGQSATLDGKTHGVLNLSKGSTYTEGFSSNTTVFGTINNSGTFQENGGNGSNTFMLLGANTTLTGKGTVNLSTIPSGGGNAYIECSSCGFTLTNTNNTIQGAGIIGNGGLSLVNGLAGTLYANVSGQTLLINGSGKITNNGTMKVASGAAMHVQNGAFTNFSGTTLTGGTYNIAGTLEIDELGASGGEIVTNAANIILSGPSSAFVDSAGKDTLSAFNTNASKGSFTINSGRNFTTAGNFTNNGTLTVGTLGTSNSTFVVNGSLMNFSGTTLAGGTYNLTGTLQFNGANIVTNAANITLTGASAQIIDQNSNNGLANFATNASGGSFTINSGRNFTTAGNFANAGLFNIGTGTNFTVGGPGVFTQTAGTTTDDGTLTDSGGLTLSGGSLFGKGTISGAVNDASGTITPGDSATKTGILTDKGAYTQGASGILDISVGGLKAGTQFDELNVTSTANLNGTLNVSLIKGFVPTIGQQFKIMNFTSETGVFLHCTCAINSSEHFQITYQGTDVLLTVVAGGGGNFAGSTLQATQFSAYNRASLASRLGFWNSRPGLSAGLDSAMMPFRTAFITPANRSNNEMSALSLSRLRSAAISDTAITRGVLRVAPAFPSRTVGFPHDNLLIASGGTAFRKFSLLTGPRSFSNDRLSLARNDLRAFSPRAQLQAAFAQERFHGAQTRSGFGSVGFNRPMARSAAMPGSRAGASGLRARTVTGGLSWGLSNLLAKPHLGFAVQ